MKRSTLFSLFITGVVVMLACSCSKTEDIPPEPPVASFTFTSRASFPVVARFTDMSATTNGVITAWIWGFGDGTSAAVQNPVHNYSTPGTYNVSLITRTNTFVYDTVVQNILIPATLDGPSGSAGKTVSLHNAAFSFNLSYSPPYSVVFVNHSTGTGNSNEWSFGDGNNATINTINVPHNYVATGPYHVVLKTTNAGGVDTCGATISF